MNKNDKEKLVIFFAALRLSFVACESSHSLFNIIMVVVLFLSCEIFASHLVGMNLFRPLLLFLIHCCFSD